MCPLYLVKKVTKVYPKHPLQSNQHHDVEGSANVAKQEKRKILKNYKYEFINDLGCSYLTNMIIKAHKFTSRMKKPVSQDGKVKQRKHQI